VAGEGRLEFLVTKMDAAKRWETGRYEWDLRGLRLRPGAVVRARLVARDNDAISGPKEGVSKTLLIRLRSPEAEHKRVEDEQKNIADGLVNLLGDQLELEAEATEKLGESPDGLPDGKKGRGARADAAAGKSAKPPVRFSRKDADDLDRKAKDIEEAVQGLIARIDRALSRVARDPRSGFDSFADLNALRGNLSYLQREMMPRARRPLEGARQGANDPPDGLRRFQAAQREITRELERMAVFADDIGKRGRLRDLANLGRRLSEAQNRLLDALDRAKPGDTEAERALREALKKVQELLNKMARALRNLPTQLPDEFMNMPTAQALNLGDLSKKLREIRRRLAAGDLEGAKKLADELVKSLSRMIAALRGALQQAMSQASGRFGRSAPRQQSVLQQLLSRQRALLEETRKIEKPVARRFREMQAEAFERAGKMAKEAVETLRRLGREVRLPPAYYRPSGEPHGEEEANALERSLSRREVPEAAGAASELRDLSREVAEALSEKVEGGPAADEKRASSAYRKLGEDFDALLSALRNLPKDPRVILTPA
ncbi:MAG: hypothetical protein ACE5IM_13490, partial [Nitrospinota bacterium]